MKLLFQISVAFAIFWEVSSRATPPKDLKCPKNMKAFLLAKNSTKQFCDCEDTFLYHPDDYSCYDAYRQGPCRSQHYFVLRPGETVAKCERNPCRIDGLVPFQGNCYFLWDSGIPCNDEHTYLGINDDFQIQCGSSHYLGAWETLKTSKSCPEHSYLLPTNEDHTNYNCECNYSFIFSPKNNSCYQAYRQGHCPSGNYVVLPPGEKEPRCEINPCGEDGLVPFKGDCHHVYKHGPPCSSNTELSVTKNTFQLECLPTGSAGGGGGGGIIDAPTKACPAGSRRVLTTCKKVFQ